MNRVWNMSIEEIFGVAVMVIMVDLLVILLVSIPFIVIFNEHLKKVDEKIKELNGMLKPSGEKDNPGVDNGGNNDVDNQPQFEVPRESTEQISDEIKEDA